MASFTRASDFISPHENEAIKQYFTYDGNGRMEYVYTALSDATDGTPCFKTQYVYDGTSNRVTKMKESLSTWTGSWDI